MPTGTGNSSGTNKCKRCKNNVTTGLKCIICGVLSHKSCLLKVKYATIIDDNLCNCCIDANNDANNEPLSVADDKQINNTTELELKVNFLEEIIKNKDIIIFNQGIAINALQDQVVLLKNSVSKPDTVQSHEVEKQFMSLKEHRNGSENPMNLNQGRAPFTNASVSNAIASAHTSNHCKKFIDLNNDHIIHSNNTFRTRDAVKPRNLLTGNMNTTSNLNLKASESQGIKYLHSTNWDPQTSTEELTKYLQGIIPSLRLEKLNSRYPQEYASFKLSVPNSEVNKIIKNIDRCICLAVGHICRTVRDFKSNSETGKINKNI
ncbi:unnamed protein product [Psylliodes chrysocephalus]|uniref:Phorbol-ester/DAG-type domain-containing protein n=1 Tax=Psylliodes chrysocephalus TaxID=3402493 RepID=A0A9P0CKL6_9CUCU|nr:unnamed protein product [Psylliodes chrysocephala]